MRALAVPAVRRGTRRAFCRASLPMTPSTRTNGQAMTRMIGLATHGAPTNMPKTATKAPAPASGQGTVARVTLSASMPPPSATRATPRVPRRRSPFGATPASPRMAATGAVRAARRAGITAAATVTRVPTARLMRTVGSVIGRLVPMSTPSAHLMPAFAAWAMSTPKPIPSADPNAPTMAASLSTELRTWPREAPSARKRASSRARCPMSIENVLTMMNAPTKRATPAKTRRNVVKKPRPCWTASSLSASTSSPVTASAEAGSTSAMESRSADWVTPCSAVTVIEGTMPSGA